MKQQLFNELVASIKEAGRIHRGEAKPSRAVTFDDARAKSREAKAEASRRSN